MSIPRKIYITPSSKPENRAKAGNKPIGHSVKRLYDKMMTALLIAQSLLSSVDPGHFGSAKKMLVAFLSYFGGKVSPLIIAFDTFTHFNRAY